ncbi:MAG TPA: methionine aminotransferase [Chloroflexia bacterium]|nr:methionine aminotransferase [Chloroflexia bacterium]
MSIPADPESPRRGAARVAGFGTSIFSEMSALARQHGAVNLSQGFPDFPSPDWIRAAAQRAIAADGNQYAISHGTPRLRQALAAKEAALYGLTYDPDREVTVTSGATEAIFATLLALLNPGEEAIVFEPCYDSYVPGIVMAGGVARPVRLEAPGWSLDAAALAAAITPRTRLILVNTPHNPTGKVFSAAELAIIADLCRRHNLIAVTDEVYEHLVFPPARHVPLATLPGMWERTVTINSTAKTFSLTGWKIGYACAPADLSDAIRRVHQFVVFCSVTPLQEAMAEAVTEAPARDYYRTFLAEYTERRDYLYQVLAAADLHPQRPEGAYFIMCDVGHLGFADDVAFARYLTTEVGVAAIPPSAFYQTPPPQQLARFCFAKNPQTLQAAAARLTAWRSRPDPHLAP